jgi:hypothetical protein
MIKDRAEAVLPRPYFALIKADPAIRAKNHPHIKMMPSPFILHDSVIVPSTDAMLTDRVQGFQNNHSFVGGLY